MSSRPSDADLLQSPTLLRGPHFRTTADVTSVPELIAQALRIKAAPAAVRQAGEGRRLGQVYLNPSLRTRMSTEIAARNLGMDVQTLNMGGEAWALEYRDGVVMDADRAEHVREAAGVLGRYVDILGLRSFPGLRDRAEDEAELVQHAFIAHSGRPLLSLESATAHPLQGFADAITLTEQWTAARGATASVSASTSDPSERPPNVVLAWAPHVRALPMAVPNSFARWSQAAGFPLTVAHPSGLDLDPAVTGQAAVTHDLDEAIADADFIYVKNWSAREPYGRLHDAPDAPTWRLDLPRLTRLAPRAKVMHCLPVRRGVVLDGAILDSPASLVLEQAHNRIWAAQTVLFNQLKSLP